MTANQQRRFYFPLWGKVCDAQDWRMENARLVGARQPAYGRAESTRLYNAVWDVAEILARHEHRAVKPDDLRHACHQVALSTPGSTPVSGVPAGVAPAVRKISSHTLTNKQLDRVAALFRVLIDPDDIDAMLAWSDPSIGEKKRLEYAIKNAAPFAYIDKICRDKFAGIYSSPFWEDLPLPALKQLVVTLKNRVRAASPSPRGEGWGEGLAMATADTVPNTNPF